MGYLKLKGVLSTNAEFNYTLNGVGFYEIDVPTAKEDLEGKKLVCAGYVANISPIKYVHIGYYKTVKEFLKVDKWLGVHSLLFRPVKDKREADLIIKMMKGEEGSNSKA